ncbi:MAG TPA: hypothetical protein VK504_17450 [Vicinamibacterales bacterium]|nr:hypothetical protein [Vicinamibacterales bacterium]
MNIRLVVVIFGCFICGAALSQQLLPSTGTFAYDADGKFVGAVSLYGDVIIKGVVRFTITPSGSSVAVRLAPDGAGGVHWDTSQRLYFQTQNCIGNAFAERALTEGVTGKTGFVGPDSILYVAIPGSQVIGGLTFGSFFSDGQCIAINAPAGSVIQLAQTVRLNDAYRLPFVLGDYVGRSRAAGH